VRITSVDRDGSTAWRGVWWALCKWKSPPADLWELNGYRRRPTGRGARDRAAWEIRSDGWTDGQTASGESAEGYIYIYIYICVYLYSCSGRGVERDRERAREKEREWECGEEHARVGGDGGGDSKINKPKGHPIKRCRPFVSSANPENQSLKIRVIPRMSPVSARSALPARVYSPLFVFCTLSSHPTTIPL